jgi:hypothetical protein
VNLARIGRYAKVLGENSVRFSRIAATAIVALIGFSLEAQAIPITRTYNFSSNSFFLVTPGDGGPVDPVFGSVTVTFDPTGGDVTGQTTGIVLHSLNLPLGSAISFNYKMSFDRLCIGGISVGSCGLTPFTNDFALVFNGASTSTPTFLVAGYGLDHIPAGFPSSCCFSSTTGSVTLAAVPEPSTFGVLGTGLIAFAGLGAMLRRRRRRTRGGPGF